MRRADTYTSVKGEPSIDGHLERLRPRVEGRIGAGVADDDRERLVFLDSHLAAKRFGWTRTVADDRGLRSARRWVDRQIEGSVGASDGKGGSVSDAFTVTVAPKPNSSPTVASAIGDLSGLREGDARQVSLAGVFTDADGDALTITASSLNNGVATATVNGQSLTVSAKQAGTTTITVTAVDPRGSSITDAFTVTVEASPAPQPEPEPEQVDTPEPEPEQEQQQDSGSASDSDLPAIVQTYDKDGSGKIEQGEWALAIADYSAQKLTTPQIQVIAGYRG